MFLLDWYREFHAIRRESRVCDSCETLKSQLASLQQQNQFLVNRLTERPEIPKVEPPPIITQPRSVPFSVRRQFLERESREQARSLRNAAKPDSAISDSSKESEKESIADLERELNIAESEREKQNT